VELNYHFIALVIGACCSLPIADYKLCNNGERGQPQMVLMSHLSVVALLAYKASMKSFGKPKQTHSVNILQLSNYSSQKNIIVKIFLHFSHIQPKGVAIRVMWQLGPVISTGSFTGLIDAVYHPVPVLLNPTVPINITLSCWDSSISNPSH
jgi:hypothetical protein